MAKIFAFQTVHCFGSFHFSLSETGTLSIITGDVSSAVNIDSDVRSTQGATIFYLFLIEDAEMFSINL